MMLSLLIFRILRDYLFQCPYIQKNADITVESVSYIVYIILWYFVRQNFLSISLSFFLNELRQIETTCFI